MIEKKPELNIDRMIESCISEMKFSYNKYKESYKNFIDLTWIGDDGSICKYNDHDKYKNNMMKWLEDYRIHSIQLEYYRKVKSKEIDINIISEDQYINDNKFDNSQSVIL